jgi:hypothetical protein
MSQAKAPFCQSCSMPMTKPEDFGNDADGSQNSDFCHYCFQNGRFTEPDITMERMIEKCAAILEQMQVSDIEIEQTKKFIPMLRRWRGQ